MTRERVFLLSPANCAGERAKLLFNSEAQFDLAVRLRSREGATLGQTFAFLSGLYFRGKLAYANTFASPPAEAQGAYIITTSRGFVPTDAVVHLDDLRELAQVPIDLCEPRYRLPLERDAQNLARSCTCDVVLLGSIATGKYADVLLEFFGQRLRLPQEFVGRGDMSRGGLMLRCVEARQELTYVSLDRTSRRGTRPAKLQPRTSTAHQRKKPARDSTPPRTAPPAPPSAA
jgi:hypothetical protein